MASANIQFDEIRASIRKPGKYFEFNTKLAVRTLPTMTSAFCSSASAWPAAPWRS